MLRLALKSPFSKWHLQSMATRMAISTDMQEDICENAIRATVHLAELSPV